MHGTRGTTGSEGCLLLHSGVGKSLIFPIPLFLLPKFDAGKPGGESVSVLLYSRTLTEFSGQAGRRVGECVSVYRRAPRVFRECSAVQHCTPRVFRINQRAGMQLKYFRSKAWLAGGRRRASLSLLRFWKAGVLPRRPAGRAKRPCRAPGRLRVRPAAQQLLGKVGLLRTQQRPLALSSVRRLQPPCNVTVRRQDALAYLRALACLAHQCIYVIFLIFSPAAA